MTVVSILASMDKCIDATIVLGGGLQDASQLSGSTKSRLDAAVERFSGEYIIVVGAGPSQLPPPIDLHGYPVFESVSAVKYLLQQGISPSRVRYEISSYDTIGNAYFSRVIHVDPASLKTLRIITSDFHLQRTKVLFEWIYSLDSTRGYDFEFVGVTDNHFSARQLQKHREKEEMRLNQIKNLQSKISSMDELHRWLFTEHAAYCAHLHPVALQDESVPKINE